VLIWEISKHKLENREAGKWKLHKDFCNAYMSVKLIKILPEGLLEWLKLNLIWVKVLAKVVQVLHFYREVLEGRIYCTSRACHKTTIMI